MESFYVKGDGRKCFRRNQFSNTFIHTPFPLNKDVLAWE